MRYSDRLLYIALALLTGTLMAQERTGIRFEKGSWASILQTAKNQGKPVFVDIYTTWCIPCRKMAAEVFVLPEVSERFNTDFINAKIDAEKGEGIDIAKRYKVGAFPTYLFVNPDGTLVYRSVGYMPADRFISESKLALKEASDPKPLAVWEDEYASRRSDTSFLWDYLQKRKRLGLDNADVTDQYASLIKRESLLGNGTLTKLLQLDRINTDGYLLTFIQANKPAVLASLSPTLRTKLDEHLANLVVKDVDRAINDQDDSLLWRITDFLMKSPSGEMPASWKAYDVRMRYYARIGDTAQLAGVFREYANAVRMFDPTPLVMADSLSLLKFEQGLADGSITVKPENLPSTRRARGSTKKTSYAYRVRDVARGALNGLDRKDLLKEALGLIDWALKYSDNFSVHEVKAGLLYKSGDREAGIKWMDKTIATWNEMSRELNLDSEKINVRLAETRQKMSEGKMVWSY